MPSDKSAVTKEVASLHAADVAADGGLTATATLITFEGVASATALGTLLSNTNFELIA